MPPSHHPSDRFSAVVDDYVKHRPSYPAELVSWIQEKLPPTNASNTVVDLGAGTGIFSRLLRDAGYRVVAVEPNAAMRARCEVTAVDGTAENTGLPAGIATGIFSAQAAHWFDLPRALVEMRRLADPSNRTLCVMLWNDRVDRGFARDLDAVYFKHSMEFRTLKRIQGTLAELRELVPSGREVEFAFSQRLDFDGVVGRSWSTSYVQHGVRDRDAFNADLRRVFDAHCKDGGEVVLEYATRVFWWWEERGRVAGKL